MAYRKLGRSSSNRKALFRSVLTAFFKNERIETTETKAKEISGLAEKLITTAKTDDLASRRKVLAFLVDEEATKKLFEVIAPKYKERNGGYTRIYKTSPRSDDAAHKANLKLIRKTLKTKKTTPAAIKSCRGCFLPFNRTATGS